MTIGSIIAIVIGSTLAIVVAIILTQKNKK